MFMNGYKHVDLLEIQLRVGGEGAAWAAPLPGMKTSVGKCGLGLLGGPTHTQAGLALIHNSNHRNTSLSTA